MLQLPLEPGPASVTQAGNASGPRGPGHGATGSGTEQAAETTGTLRQST